MPRLPQLTTRELIAFLKLLRGRTRLDHKDMFTCASRGFDPECFALAADNYKSRLLK